MIITDFSQSHVESARKLALENYNEERAHVCVLPRVDSIPDLSAFVDWNLGVAMMDGENLCGFLCFYPFRDNVFGMEGLRGTFSPIHAHGFVKQNRERICKQLYQSVAEKLMVHRIRAQTVALYAHDETAIHSFFVNGFGMRTIDAVNSIDDLLQTIPNHDVDEIRYRELDNTDKAGIRELNNLLIQHLGQSPMFMEYPLLNSETLQQQMDSEQNRYFAAYKDETMAAYIKIMDDGENFACDAPDMLNIQGACCLPTYRGTGLYRQLLAYTVKTLKKEGYQRLGVDFESFNPAAYGFWLKHFRAYTHGLTRRIDG